MSSALFVHYEGELIGQLRQEPSGQMAFAYEPSWSQSPHAFPISISLPLDGSFSATASHYYFANLLPEANVRQQICRSLGISLSNDFALLHAIGGDCAGALTITPQATLNREPSRSRYEPTHDDQLAKWSIGTPDAFSAVTGQNEVRLSLAGAQDKLPVHIEGEQIFVPVGHAASTYLLKFASPFYSHLPENETFISLLAREVGLPVVDVRLRTSTKARFAVIARYDRQLHLGQFRRVHQEDFCQALGISPLQKYEKEGGPSLHQCAEIIRRHTSFPIVELQKLLRWTLFNLIVGNADAHGKNLSLLYREPGTLELAPFYDLVCTRNYKKISRNLAMNIGGVADPDLVSARHLQSLAEDLQIRWPAVKQALQTMLEKIHVGLPQTIEKFHDAYGNSPMTLRLPIIIRKQLRRLQGQLG